jgi:UDP-3-O-[3-hydroxymyristoyl] glucosamine N-acyltransferase
MRLRNKPAPTISIARLAETLAMLPEGNTETIRGILRQEGASNFRMHPNGGGLVHKKAKVSISSFVDGSAIILGYNEALGRFTTIKSAMIGPYTIIYSGVGIGSDVRIGGQCSLYEGVEVGNNVQIDNNITINGAVIHDGVIIKPAARIGDHSKINRCTFIGTNVLIEDNVEIGRMVLVHTGITIHSGAKIGDGNTVGRDLNPNEIIAGKQLTLPDDLQ